MITGNLHNFPAIKRPLGVEEDSIYPQNPLERFYPLTFLSLAPKQTPREFISPDTGTHPKPASQQRNPPPQITSPSTHRPPPISPKKRNKTRTATRPPRAPTEPSRNPHRHRHRTRRGSGNAQRRNGGRFPIPFPAASFQAAAAPPQPGPPPAPDHTSPRDVSPTAQRQPSHLLPLLPLPPPPAAEATGLPRRAAEGGAAAGGLRGAAVPAVRGAAAVARGCAGVAVADVPALRPLLRAELVQRQGGRLRPLGPPPRRPPRLLLLLPRHGLRHPRPGAAPPRRPHLPPLPREQPPDARPRRRRSRRHLSLHVHLRAQGDTDTLPDEPRAAANRAELCRRLCRFCEEDRVVVGQVDRRREAKIVRGNCVVVEVAMVLNYLRKF